MTEPFTKEQLLAYAESRGTTCPYCGSASIEGETFEVSRREAWQNIYCQVCGESWQDVYTLFGIAPHTNGEDAQELPR